MHVGRDGSVAATSKTSLLDSLALQEMFFGKNISRRGLLSSLRFKDSKAVISMYTSQK